MTTDKPVLEDKLQDVLEIRDLKQDNTKLKFIVDEQQKEIGEKEKKILEVTDEHKKLNDAHSTIQSQYEASVKENETLKMENGGLAESIKTAKEEGEKIKQEHGDLKSEYEKINDDNENTKTELQKLQRENFRLKREMHSELSDAQKYVTELEDNCESLEEEINSLKHGQLNEEEMLFYNLCLADVCLSKLGKSSCTHRDLMAVGFPTKMLRQEGVEGVQTSNFLVQRDGEKNKYKISKL